MPFHVCWPRKLTPGESQATVFSLDILPTALAACGINVAAASAANSAKAETTFLDGINLIPLFDRKTEVRSKAIPFWNHAGAQPGHAALLDWPYKLHTNPVAGRDKKGKKGGEALPTLLYDVSKDPKETTDLAAKEPERVAKMTAALEAWKASVERSLAGEDYGAQSTEIAPKKKKKK